MISGVHYGANGDLVAGQKDTKEMHMRTHELLKWLDRERPIVVMGPDPCNNIHKNAIIACSHGKRIGRVSKNDVDKAWDLLRQSGNSMLIARVSEVIIKDHGYVMLTIDADELQPTPAAPSPETVWKEWMEIYRQGCRSCHSVDFWRKRKRLPSYLIHYSCHIWKKLIRPALRFI